MLRILTLPYFRLFLVLPLISASAFAGTAVSGDHSVNKSNNNDVNYWADAVDQPDNNASNHEANYWADAVEQVVDQPENTNRVDNNNSNTNNRVETITQNGHSQDNQAANALPKNLSDSLLSCGGVADKIQRLACFDALVPVKKVPYTNATVADLQALLSANHFTVGKSRKMFHELLSAIEGMSFEVNGALIEAYAFDFNDDKGQQAFKLWSNEGIVGHYPLRFKNLLIKIPGTHPEKRRISILLNEIIKEAPAN